jgi:hypothetical protein
MEPSRRNHWQSAANRPSAETARPSQIRCRELPLVAAHGKEGVDGSSPSEGFAKSLQITTFRPLLRRHGQGATSTERPRAGESASSAAVIR